MTTPVYKIYKEPSEYLPHQLHSAETTQTFNYNKVIVHCCLCQSSQQAYLAQSPVIDDFHETKAKLFHVVIMHNTTRLLFNVHQVSYMQKLLTCLFT